MQLGDTITNGYTKMFCDAELKLFYPHINPDYSINTAVTLNKQVKYHPIANTRMLLMEKTLKWLNPDPYYANNILLI